MKTEVKKELVQALRKMGDERVPVMKQHPIIKILIPILSKRHPDVEFNNLIKSDSTKNLSWDDIKKYAGISRIDFDIPGYIFSRTNSNTGDLEELNPMWDKSYQHPTVGSIISLRHFNRMPLSYSELGNIIEQNIVTID